jgi:DNA-directed RNA polymerase specialized sigma24 family protein
MTEPEPDTFQNLIERVRARDEGAATELVRRYEPMVRRAARVRLADRLLDSMDICQPVMASFFVHLSRILAALEWWSSARSLHDGTTLKTSSVRTE